uniref:Reverse transcriptase domain-containing protein n=1 Tax=Tanacetum cinerariifolium TaxID=118510 RepID=A0A6L2K2N0_TANCI|nr:reverse transcriptase domain-containing protein [Tanacetum cinerariifolium]
MTTAVEKRNASKFCEFHGEWKSLGKGGHKEGNLKKGKTAGNTDGEEDGTEGLMIIEAEMGGHSVHRIYVDEGSSSEILYEHCFNRFRPEIGDEEHSTPAWMNFMVVRTPSPSNGIIGRPGVRRIQAVPSTVGYSIRMHNGFRTRNTTTCNKPGHKRKRSRMSTRQIKEKRAGPERNKAIYKEVEKMVDASIMKKVHYHIWLSNPVLVKKHEELTEDDPQDTTMEDEEALLDPWILFTDGSSCIDGFTLPTTKEYESLIAGLQIAEQMGIKNLQANVDLWLVANQVNETYIAKEPGMIKYLENVKALANTFKEFCINKVPRGENKKVDALSKIASTSFAHLIKKVLVDELKEKSIYEKEVLAVVEDEGHTWMTPIHEYLVEEIQLEEKKKARAVHHKAKRYNVKNEVLYTKSFLRPWLRCVRPLQTNHVLRETHEGSCSMHVGPRSVPFYKWGIDIAGPFMNGPRKVKFLIVAIDYLNKWIEAKPVATIMGAQIKKFVWDNIVCRFGLPGEIISDNEKQFMDNPFKDWCENLCIRQCFAFVKHLQANGLVERANMSLSEGIKARLDERSKTWLEEISHVLWAHRIMIKFNKGETSFSLTYGTEAVIPVEIGMPTLRTAEVNMIKNNESLGINMDILDEKREQATIQEAKIKA